MWQILDNVADKLGIIFNGVWGKIGAIATVVSLSALPVWVAKSRADLESTGAIIVALLPAALIAIYGVLACAYVSKSKSVTAESIADFTYFLGYLCTITALAVLVVCMGAGKEDLMDVRTITLVIGMKLTATIAGLIFMILIKEFYNPVPSQMTEEVVNRLGDVISNSRDAFGTLCRECRDTGTTLSSLRGQADEFVKTIADCNEVIGGGKSKLDEYATTTGQCVGQMERLLGNLKKLSTHELPPDLVPVLGKAIKGVYLFDEQCKAAGESVQGLGTSVDACTKNVSSMSLRAAANEQQIKKNEQQTKEATAQLVEYVKAVGQTITQMDSLLNSLKRLSAHPLPNNIADQLGQAIAGFQALDAQCKTAAGRVQGFGLSAEKCEKGISSMNSKVATNEQQIEQYTRAVSELRKVLGQFAQLMIALIGKAAKPPNGAGG